jgi:hypothetical protein
VPLINKRVIDFAHLDARIVEKKLNFFIKIQVFYTIFNRAPFFRMLPVLLPTLLLLASKKVAALAEGRVPTILRGLPAQVAEEVVSQMNGLELLEFIASEGGIHNIKKKFTTNGFQKFFLRFLFVYDSRKVHVSIKLQLMKELRAF